MERLLNRDIRRLVSKIGNSTSIKKYDLDSYRVQKIFHGLGFKWLFATADITKYSTSLIHLRELAIYHQNINPDRTTSGRKSLRSFPGRYILRRFSHVFKLDLCFSVYISMTSCHK